MSTTHRASAGLALGLALAASSGMARASSDSAPTAPEIDRVEREAHEAGLGPELLGRPLREARHALERARGARAAGDEPHAALLDRLAGEWLGLASATLRAVRAENATRAETKRTAELRTKLERGRALLAEEQARQGRLQAEVLRLEREREASSGKAGQTHPPGAGPSAKPSGKRPQGPPTGTASGRKPSSPRPPESGDAARPKGKP
jgi:hypothetical protein